MGHLISMLTRPGHYVRVSHIFRILLAQPTLHCKQRKLITKLTRKSSDQLGHDLIIFELNVVHGGDQIQNVLIRALRRIEALTGHEFQNSFIETPNLEPVGQMEHSTGILC